MSEKEKSWVVRKPSHTFFTIFGIMAVLLLPFGIYLSFSLSSQLSNGIKAPGKVIELVVRRSLSTSSSSRSVSNDVYAPKVAFQTTDGETITFESENATNPPTHEVGEKVEIIYQPDDPHSAIINSFFHTWFLPLLLMVCGSIAAAIALIALYFIVYGEKLVQSLETKISQARSMGQLQDAEKLLAEIDKRTAEK